MSHSAFNDREVWSERQSNLDAEILRLVKKGVYAFCGVHKLAAAMGDKYATVWAMLNRAVVTRLFKLLACYVRLTGDKRPLRHLCHSCGFDIRPIIKNAVRPEGQGDLFKEEKPFAVDPHYAIERSAERIRRDVDEIIFANGRMA
jgi:hypothetical protein